MLEIQHNGSNAPSIRSLVVDDERTKQGYWLVLVLCAIFSALTLMLGWQDSRPGKIPSLLIPEGLFQNRQVGLADSDLPEQ